MKVVFIISHINGNKNRGKKKYIILIWPVKFWNHSLLRHKDKAFELFMIALNKKLRLLSWSFHHCLGSSSSYFISSLVFPTQDTAGSERYEAMSRIYYRGARAAIVCYGKSILLQWRGDIPTLITSLDTHPDLLSKSADICCVCWKLVLLNYPCFSTVFGAL